ncbi:MAG: aldo/keto reductase [Gammaproteobacteria bacterium]|nr:aldo/keto reductase [Gammaproteobacteria bacterium]MYA66874.1 aldo/keto reductase [Gammaproteobacteria bacterium]MYC60936.1 aldo/keto reductase [Gammaproteobacteria bacterium]MYH47668.1 aldo/keto reductase [Gammaproteobacteria bacterium]MYH86584.1 aldo/keto reductase [Gammaproteobacteria bacterium]
MEYRYVGRSGLRVTPICMGTMSFGTWSDKAESFRILDKSFDRGINFFDTAEAYPVPPTAELAGLTEEIFGEWLKQKPRDAVIVATKVAGAAGGWFVPPIRHGMTAVDRHHIERAVEGSLRRMDVDYIDLYQVHWPDPIVPMEESMAALDRLVESGKVRYLGTSNETSYGLTKSNMIAEYEGLARFESIQNNFSLLHRRFLDELAQVCRNEKVSLLPYSPIGGGVLSGKYNDGKSPPNTRFGDYESSNPRQQAMARRFVNEGTLASTAKYVEIARDAGLSPVTLATRWSMEFDFVASTIIGARTADQLDDSLAALDIELSEEVKAACDEVHRQFPYPMG